MSPSLDSSISLLSRVRSTFEQRFGRAPGLVARAPGRVNLIGEHTDYNDGFVLPCAIDFQTLVAASPRDDGLVRVHAADIGPQAFDEFRLDQLISRRDDAPWTHYVRGMVQSLLVHGWPIGGADLVLAGDLPQGAGLSSSASLEVAVGQAFKSLYGLDRLPAVELARLAQQAENQFVGCRCGIMDQLISACGEAGHALLIDCRSLATRPVSLPPGLAVLIVHSRVQRGLVESEYNLRRQQCEAAARHYGVAALRDLDLERLERDRAGLDALSWRRARHVVSENQRTLAAARALEQHDLAGLGELMAASHASMRDDFEITVPAIDRLVALLQAVVGQQGGARMTGGGFGGCVVALMPEALVGPAQAALAQHYRAPSGETATVYLCRPGAGAGLLDSAALAPLR